MLCCIMSALSCPVCPAVPCPVLSYHVILRPVLSCDVTSKSLESRCVLSRRAIARDMSCYVTRVTSACATLRRVALRTNTRLSFAARLPMHRALTPLLDSYARALLQPQLPFPFAKYPRLSVELHTWGYPALLFFPTSLAFAHALLLFSSVISSVTSHSRLALALTTSHTHTSTPLTFTT